MSGNPVRLRREELQLSQEGLAAALGVEPITVSRWERDEAIPQRRLWPKLQAVGIPVGDVLARAASREAAE